MRAPILAFAAAVLATSAAAAQAPLSLSDFSDMRTWLACTEATTGFGKPAACQGLATMPPGDYETIRLKAECDAACGEPDWRWEKDGVPPIDVHDLRLAGLEYQWFSANQSGTQAFCYVDPAKTILRELPLCPGAGVCGPAALLDNCTADKCALPNEPGFTCTTDAQGQTSCVQLGARPALCLDVVCQNKASIAGNCEDQDGNGFPDWFDDASTLGGATTCHAGKPCAPDEQCALNPGLGVGRCVDRGCGAHCTLFHLEVVSVDDQEVVVFVHFDHAPSPARVLDLYLTYPVGHLQPAEARPLAPLTIHGKSVASQVLPGGLFRVAVLDPDGAHPIPTGPIVEVVFRRTGTCAPDPEVPNAVDPQCRIGFTDNPELLQQAMAPATGLDPEVLADSQWWGRTAVIPAKDQATVKLRLWYDFEDLKSPLSYRNVPDAVALCERIPACANLSGQTEAELQERGRFISRLAALQSGGVVGGTAIMGVAAGGIHFGGSHDHVRMPVHWVERASGTAPGAQIRSSDQDVTFSTWFYVDEPAANLPKAPPQVLFSHHAGDERTRYGVWVRPDASNGGKFKLAFFEGDALRDPADLVTKESVIAPEVAARSWHHVAASVRASDGQVWLYLDGRNVVTTSLEVPPLASVCPTVLGGTAVALQTEGNVPGGRPPEVVYRSVKQSGRWRIVRSDGHGLEEETILQDGAIDFRDPDYNPGLDRLVFVSTESGSTEVWVSDGQGSSRLQLTRGFGDPDLGYAARRPRWAPDGSAIVFDSRAFDGLSLDNHLFQVSHLYWIGWDPTENQPRNQSPSGGQLEALDYDALVLTGDIHGFRLTKSLDTSTRNARWLTGKRPVSGGTELGRLIAQTSAPGGDEGRIAVVTVKETPAQATSETVPLGTGLAGEELHLVDARRYDNAGIVPPATERVLAFREWSEYIVEPKLTFADTCGSTGAGATCQVTVSCSGADCPGALYDLYVAYDPARLTPELDSWVSSVLPADAQVKLTNQLPSAGGGYVKVQITRSPALLSPSPLSGTLGSFSFTVKQYGDKGLSLRRLAHYGELRAVDLAIDPATPGMVGVPAAIIDPAGHFESVQDGGLSLDLSESLLLVYHDSRPRLLRVSVAAQSAAEAQALTLSSQAVSGLSWRNVTRYSPCNFAGAVRHPAQQLTRRALRGGLDELKVYSGLRDPHSIRSEAERTLEHLQKQTCTTAEDCHDGLVCLSGHCRPAPAAQSCTAHVECPPFHVCSDGACQIRPCDPDDAAACQSVQAQCTLRPLAVNLETEALLGAGFDWVCAADCNADAHCFKQACLNGPCRFCDLPTHSCIECREDTGEGCPDPQTFRCEAGTCVSDCYATVDEQTLYACDPTTEFCEGGRCVAREYRWADFAPASLTGLSPMRRVIPGFRTTQVIDQRGVIEVIAYGQDGFGYSPEVEVEVRGGGFYDGQAWTRVGSFLVHHRTLAAAKATPFTLTTSHSFSEIRLRLVSPAYQNPSGGPTALKGTTTTPTTVYAGCHAQITTLGGTPEHKARAAVHCLRQAGAIGEADADFCLSDHLLGILHAGYDQPVTDAAALYDAAIATATQACSGPAFESLPSLGYPAEVPVAQVAAACTGAGCPVLAPSDQGRDQLPFGSRSVVISDVTVDGASALFNAPSVTNTICPTNPVDGAQVVRSLGAPLFAERCRSAQSCCSGACEDAACRAAMCALNDKYCVTWDDAARQCAQGNAAITAANGLTCADVAAVCRCDTPGEWSGQALCQPAAVVNHDAVGLGYGLLNCARYQSGDGTARLELAGLIPDVQPDVIVEGNVTEGPLGCVVELSEALSIPCLAVQGSGADASGDPAAVQGLSHGALDFTLLRTFGYDTCGPGCTSTSSAAPVTITDGSPGTPGVGAVLALDGENPLTLVTFPAVFSGPVPVGHPYAVTIIQQPADAWCVLDGPATGVMSAGGAQVAIRCTPAANISLSATNVVGPTTVSLTVTPPGAVAEKSLHEVTAAGVTLLGSSFVGAQVAMAVTVQPDGSSCTASGPAALVAGGVTWTLTCTDKPTRPLAATVAGLSGSVTVLDQASGTSKTLTANGQTPLFDAAIGAPYSFVVTAQPEGQVCNFQISASGVVTAPASVPFLLPTLLCTSLPTYELRGLVYGLTTEGITLSVVTNRPVGGSTGGTTTQAVIAAPSSLVPSVAFGPYSVTAGTAWQVTIQTAPANMTCAVGEGFGVVGSAAPAPVQVFCQPTGTAPAAQVGGTITGLTGNGLQLVLRDTNMNAAVGNLSVPAGAGTFAFPNGVPAGTAYEVVVGAQPSGSPQICTVTNGKGTLGAQSVTNVAVSCASAATLTVEVTRPASSGSGVGAWLVDKATASVVAVGPGDVKIGSTSVTFVMRTPLDGPTPGVKPNAHLVPSTQGYRLYVMVNHNGNTSSTGEPIFDGGDVGAALELTLVAGQAQVRQVADSELHPLLAAWSEPSIEPSEKQVTRCYWMAPEASGTTAVIPPAQATPVIATTVYTGTDDGMDAVLGFVPPGTWRVSCWTDKLLAGSSGNGIVDTGDTFGSTTVTLQTWETQKNVTVFMGVQ